MSTYHSSRYKRHEVQKRFVSLNSQKFDKLTLVYVSLSVFYLLSVTAGGLSPILAYAFSLLNGKGGLAGWRWIFVGVLVVCPNMVALSIAS